MDNVFVWRLCDSDDSDSPNNFNEEDLLTHYREKPAMRAWVLERKLLFKYSTSSATVVAGLLSLLITSIFSSSNAWIRCFARSADPFVIVSANRIYPDFSHIFPDALIVSASGFPGFGTVCNFLLSYTENIASAGNIENKYQVNATLFGGISVEYKKNIELCCNATVERLATSMTKKCSEDLLDLL